MNKEQCVREMTFEEREKEDIWRELCKTKEQRDYFEKEIYQKNTELRQLEEEKHDLIRVLKITLKELN